MLYEINIDGNHVTDGSSLMKDKGHRLYNLEFKSNIYKLEHKWSWEYYTT